MGTNYKLLGDREPFTPNEPDDIIIHYYLKGALKDKVKVTVSELSGETVAVLEGKPDAGFQTVSWGLDRQAKPGSQEPPAYGEWRSNQVDPGTYVVTVEAGGQKFTKKAVIRERWGWSVGPFPEKIK